MIFSYFGSMIVSTTKAFFILWSFMYKFWRKEWQSTPVFLPREFHGQRSLTGCSPWGRKESDKTESHTHTHTHTHTHKFCGFPCGANAKRTHQPVWKT